MKKSKSYNDDENNDDEKMNIDMIMDSPPKYGGYNYKNCEGLYQFRSDDRFSLCNIESFNQYCIRFKTRSRLFTVMGETHQDFSDFSECKNIKVSGIEHPVDSLFTIGNYFEILYREYNEMNRQISETKNLKVFIELSPILDFLYQSKNIDNLLQWKDIITKRKYENKNYIDVPLFERVDIRYIDSKKYSFFTRIYQSNFKGITIKDLKNEQKENSHLKKEILPLLERLLIQDSKYSIKQMYEEEHYKILVDFYKDIIEEFNYIKKLVDSINEYDNDKDIDDIKDIDDRILKVIEKYRYAISFIIDYYVLTQVFRKDYYSDHIIFLVGEKHAQTIKSRIQMLNIFNGPIKYGYKHSVNSMSSISQSQTKQRMPVRRGKNVKYISLNESFY